MLKLIVQYCNIYDISESWSDDGFFLIISEKEKVCHGVTMTPWNEINRETENIGKKVNQKIIFTSLLTFHSPHSQLQPPNKKQGGQRY